MTEIFLSERNIFPPEISRRKFSFSIFLSCISRGYLPLIFSLSFLSLALSLCLGLSFLSLSPYVWSIFHFFFPNLSLSLILPSCLSVCLSPLLLLSREVMWWRLTIKQLIYEVKFFEDFFIGKKELLFNFSTGKSWRPGLELAPTG